MKRVICSFFIALSICMVTSCSDDFEYNSVEEVSVDNDDSLIDLYSALLDNLSSQTRGINSEYPDFYGGAYLDGSCLVVQIKEGVYDIPSFIQDNDNIKIKYCRYSLNELNAIMNKLNKIFIYEKNILNPVGSNIGLYSVSQKNNCVEVYLKKCTAYEIKLFKEMVLESSAIQFKQRVDDNEIVDWDDVFIRFPLNRTKYSVYPGANIAYVEDGGKTPRGYSSAGYKAKYNNKIGFVTAGHGITTKDVGALVKTTEAFVVGKCVFQYHSDSIDVAFFEVNSSSEVTHKILNGSNIISSEIAQLKDLPENSKVYFAGSRSQGEGVIKSLNTTNPAGGITNLVSASYNSKKGDSGGLVYIVKNGKNVIAGIHNGKSDGIPCFVKALSIENAVSITSCD